MSWAQGLMLVGAAFGAGALNAVAGGGTFLTFPALLLVGVEPIRANATSTIVLWPGAAASALAYRRQLSGQGRRIRWLVLASFLGGGLGAGLLLWTPAPVFARLIPFLLLVATLLFTFSEPLLARLLERRGGRELSLPAVACLQGLVAIYGGYFGAGLGIMMLALFSLLRSESIHVLNALKSLMGAAMNAVALAVFVAAGAIDWSKGLLMMGGAIAGGYLGAVIAQRIPPRWVRRFVIVTAWATTAYFFWKQLL